MERLIRLPEVKHQTGLGKTSIYEGIKAGTFPAPVSLQGTRSVAWIESEITAWQQQRVRRGTR